MMTLQLVNHHVVLWKLNNHFNHQNISMLIKDDFGSEYIQTQKNLSIFYI